MFFFLVKRRGHVRTKPLLPLEAVESAERERESPYYSLEARKRSSRRGKKENPKNIKGGRKNARRRRGASRARVGAIGPSFARQLDAHLAPTLQQRDRRDQLRAHRPKTASVEGTLFPLLGTHHDFFKTRLQNNCVCFERHRNRASPSRPRVLAAAAALNDRRRRLTRGTGSSPSRQVSARSSDGGETRGKTKWPQRLGIESRRLGRRAEHAEEALHARLGVDLRPARQYRYVRVSSFNLAKTRTLKVARFQSSLPYLATIEDCFWKKSRRGRSRAFKRLSRSSEVSRHSFDRSLKVQYGNTPNRSVGRWGEDLAAPPSLGTPPARAPRSYARDERGKDDTKGAFRRRTRGLFRVSLERERERERDAGALPPPPSQKNKNKISQKKKTTRPRRFQKENKGTRRAFCVSRKIEGRRVESVAHLIAELGQLGPRQSLQRREGSAQRLQRVAHRMYQVPVHLMSGHTTEVVSKK